MDSDLTLASIRLQYAFRSAFYLRRSSEIARAWTPNRLSSEEQEQINWDHPQSFGISKVAWEYVYKAHCDPVVVFCHPRLLQLRPACLDYYVRSALLSKKGFAVLLRNTRACDKKLDKWTAQAITINNHVSTLIETYPGFLKSDKRLLCAMSFGAEVNGSWRNRIGHTGSTIVKELILNHFLDTGKIVSFVTSAKRKMPSRPRNPDNIRAIILVNGYIIEFGSEPDVSVRSPEGTLEVAMEIKAGLDPAGALERYGACKKSFDRAFKENRAVHTIYLASCMTPAVMHAIESDRLVRAVYDLGAIISDTDKRREFLKELTWTVHL